MARFRDTRRRTLALAAPLSAEDQAIQSMPDASPTKWHLAHTTWFFEEFLLATHAPAYARFDCDYAYLFNSYYEGVGPRHARGERGLLSRPPLEEVHAYRRHVDAAVTSLLDAGSLDPGAGQAFEVGLCHEEQHQELMLMDIKHLLSRNPLRPSYGAKRREVSAAAPALSWREFPGGLYFLGADAAELAFDNERPRHRVWIEPFRIASRAVTNGEYRDFIEDGGYRRPELWLFDGWQAVGQEAWRAPLYWSADLSMQFTLAGEQPLDAGEPVCHISYYEADAFARWNGKRLPREAEWEYAARSVCEQGRFAASGEFHPRAAGAGELTQMFGDVWEWTASPYAAYPGFRPQPGTLGEYNGKFMCGQFVLRGGSAATPEGHVRPSYRNFFPPGARWAFAGLRLADDAAR